MSFSNRVREELSKLEIESKLLALLELSSILKVNASISIRNAFINISFISESEYVAKRIYKLIYYLYSYEPVISQHINNSINKEGIFNITVESNEIASKLIADSGIDMFGNYNTTEEKIFSRLKSAGNKGYSAYLRGLFLGVGSIVDPNKSYHLELILNNEEDLRFSEKVLNEVNIETLSNIRKDKYIIYLKNSDLISNFLLTIKATNSMLELENIKVEKDVRNNINRRMNFDMANINKVVETSLKQIQDIEIIEKYSKMPEDLVELSELRKNNSEISLKTLGEMMNPPVSKSTVAYKMKKIRDIANKIKKDLTK